VKAEPCPRKSEDSLLLSGTVVSGARQAAFFTQLDWVRSQCLDRLGFEPFPGTLNLQISEQDRPAAAKLFRLPGKPLETADGSFCAGRVYPVCIGTIPGAIVRPEEGVRIHDDGVIEILAPVSLREKLQLKDGDRIGLTVRL
jgi:CTP-dependent riboflavin kinase